MNSFFVMLTAVLISTQTFAHGENKPGPHGGYIQMPGNFHTEVVPLENGNLKVYLLDLHFKNPTLKDSKIQTVLMQGKKKTELKCVEKVEHFNCSGVPNLKSGTLIISSTREGTKASMNAEYKLPFVQFKKDDSEKEVDHSMHH